MVGPNEHQLFQAFPKLDSLIVDVDGHWTQPWYRFMITIWQKLGGSGSNIQNATFIVNNPNGSLTAHAALTGDAIGPVPTGNDVLIPLVIFPPQDPSQSTVTPIVPGDNFVPLQLIPPGDPPPDGNQIVFLSKILGSPF